MTSISTFNQISFTANGTTKTVYHKGDSGPAILIMHELPGMIPECIALANRLVERGFRVYLPLLFGQPGENKPLKFSLQLCISREFYLFARNKSSPITIWLRALCREIDERTNGHGLGVIGMCLTGGFALSLILDDAVKAPVLSQPSIPAGLTQEVKAALPIAPHELDVVQKRVQQEGLDLLGLRFTCDFLCTEARFDHLTALFGERFKRIEIDSGPGNAYGLKKSAHAVLTADYDDTPGHPTRQAFEAVVDFMEGALGKKV